MKKKEKTYLVFIERCDNGTICKRMNGDQIRKELSKSNQEDLAIVDGNLVKGFGNKMDLSKLR